MPHLANLVDMENEGTGYTEVREWLERVTENATTAAIARAINVPQRTFANHVTNGILSAEEVIAIARAYNYSPVYALIELGFLTHGEVEAEIRDHLANDIPVRELLSTAIQKLDEQISAGWSLTSSLEERAGASRKDDPKRLTLLPSDLFTMLIQTYAGDVEPREFRDEVKARRGVKADNVIAFPGGKPHISDGMTDQEALDQMGANPLQHAASTRDYDSDCEREQ